MPKVLICTDFLTQSDKEAGKVLSGSFGYEVQKWLKKSHINLYDCAFTYVFDQTTVSEDLDTYLVTQKEALEMSFGNYPFPPFIKKPKKYFHPSIIFPAIEFLRSEVQRYSPNIVLTLGQIPAWAFLGNPTLSAIRGFIAESTLIPKLKILPTFHPSYVFQNYSERYFTFHDVEKLSREMEFPEIIYPTRKILIEPTFRELVDFFYLYDDAEYISIDIETRAGQITCICFAPAKDICIVVPFVDDRKSDGSYWTEEEEIKVMKIMNSVLRNSSRKIFQNGMYDIQYIFRAWGIPVLNATEDTILMHHSLYSELPKGLGILGSVYTNEGEWKTMRTNTAVTETLKSDE